jgi:hypothetical protein
MLSNIGMTGTRLKISFLNPAKNIKRLVWPNGWAAPHPPRNHPDSSPVSISSLVIQGLFEVVWYGSWILISNS